MARLPLSVQAIESSYCVRTTPRKKQTAYSTWIWVLTFITYCAYHMSRKPISVVKSVLNQNCSDMTPPDNTTNNTHWCDWAPFDGDNSASLLSTVDSSFLFAYAVSMFLSGMVAERIDLRIFLSAGMVLSGAFCAMFGLGYTFKIHYLWFYILAQVLSGLVQSTGWPGVVTCMANWFGKGKRGLIMGIWNSHTSLGNILGTVIAASFVTENWALSFIIPGLIIAALGVLVFFFMVPDPSLVSLPNPNNKEEGVSPPQTRRQRLPNFADTSDEEAASLLDHESPVNYDDKTKEAQRRLRCTPGMTRLLDSSKLLPFREVEFSLCLFFAKLVSYTFLYWLPYYINSKEDSGGVEESANLSTFFDVGGIIGGILAGVVSDYSGMSASTCSVMLIVAIPMMFVYQTFGSVSNGMNIFLLILVGILVNGPYALITTAVSADLGTHKSLKGNAKALATVTAIIDGTGSIGAAVGPQLAGPISNYGWSYVFLMLMVSDLLALLLLTRLVMREVRGWYSKRRQQPHTPL
ncbi:LOW QUALITY PROTEIN: glucose-6-phosphate exchanger SLC37A2-like [Eriocheir sinensis]|uniref:LOW QUALITY PROTEIN: glucose-6-phosphate exchanger SLC37A2-like n=1 Tax=Eriocheir sinensis TaxID=95602 RepID=UPI0021C9B95A|nr:LOW QUALITY PROTEIN: glucose-6-phosphate exchanger SLC37A2-like [Eriocheir sinensis]